MRKGKIYCPVNGWSCPYYKNGECALENPIQGCVDFGIIWHGSNEDEYTCYDEERTVFEC